MVTVFLFVIESVRKYPVGIRTDEYMAVCRPYKYRLDTFFYTNYTGFLFRFINLAIKTPAGAASRNARTAERINPMAAMMPIHRNA